MRTTFLNLFMCKQNVDGFECLTRYLLGDGNITQPVKSLAVNRLTGVLGSLSEKLRCGRQEAELRRLCQHRQGKHESFFFLRCEGARSG